MATKSTARRPEKNPPAPAKPEPVKKPPPPGKRYEVRLVEDGDEYALAEFEDAASGRACAYGYWLGSEQNHGARVYVVIDDGTEIMIATYGVEVPPTDDEVGYYKKHIILLELE